MSYKLLIVESLTKAKTIQKYLGPGYKVQASIGHVRDLPKSKLGVDPDHGFSPEYEIPSDKSKVVSELRSAAKSADAVYLATDPDREGEAIAWHVLEVLRVPKSKPVYRVTFHEITKSAVQDAVAHPRQIDTRLVDAQQARRVLDRLVGYRLSPLLWEKVKRGLSAGRVQSVAVRLVVDREREIEDFKPQEYWTIEADLRKQQGNDRLFRAVMVERAGKKLGKFDIGDKDAADVIVKDLDGAAFQIQKVTRKDKKRTPAPPFTTSTLQQEASRKLGFGAKKTMMVAQQLYEGVDVGNEGTVGLITYMRTDSLSVSQLAQNEARALIAKKYGEEYVPAKPNVYKTRTKGAQEAHEAIRPTGVQREPANLRTVLNRDQYRLYELIWKRFVASQMAAAIFDSTSVDIAAGRRLSGSGTPPYLFRATGSVLKFPGFLAVYNVGLDEGEEDEDKEAILPPLSEGELLRLIELLALQHWTQPPPRYTEASLVKELEKLGIGRPSTYAPTISTIQAREYATVVEKKLVPTSLGRVVTDLLVQHFSDIVDYNFTSQMEQQLDDIAEGERQWVPVIKGFYDPFEQTIARAKSEMRGVKGETVETDIPCPTCGAPLGIKWGRNGEFLACTRHPECSFTGDLARDAEGRVQLAEQPKLADGEQICDKCGRPMAIKQGRFGPFLACTGYPDCKNIRNLAKTNDGGLVVAEQVTEHHCPKCDKPMIRKSGRWGPYLACSDYPDCKTIQKLDRSGQPKPPAQITDRICPESGHHLALKQGRYGPFLSCTGYPRCRYIEKLPADGTMPRILTDAEVEALPKPEPTAKAEKKTTRTAKSAASNGKTTKAATKTATKSTAKAATKSTAKTTTKTSTTKRATKQPSRAKQPA
ncbi:MAG: type I DNA topoisomerase [Chloroflexi bacterium]|nr:type I DNA topoisomerase [Chloroflexota bacterium]